MDFIVETERRTPVAASTDVVVIGGGPAGTAAAVQAGRQGASVVLIEQSGMLGGVGTAGLMSHWTGETRGGIYEEILDRCMEKEAAWNGSVFPGLAVAAGASMGKHGEGRQLINHEVLRSVLLEMCGEAGVDVRLYSFASTPVMRAASAGTMARMAGVIVQSKSGREAFLAKVVVDASGDGDMAAAAGVPFIKGRDYDGKMQPMTDMLKVGGVDTSRVRYVPGFEDSYAVPAGDLQTVARTRIPYPAGHVLIYPTGLPGTVVLNMTNCTKVDGTRTVDLVRGEQTCRSQIGPIIDFLRAEVPGFEKAYLIQSASSIGVRETRHFQGEETLTEKDIMEAKIFDDWVVARNHFNFDVHNLEGAGLDETGVQQKFSQRRGYTIPYGCFLPKQVDGLLMVGRCISGTHMAHSCYRVMPICANMGQAVGIAASLAAASGIEPRTVDAKQIQAILMELGVDPESPVKVALKAKGRRMETMTNRERLLGTLRGQSVDRTPIWLLFPWHTTSYYTDVRSEPSYREVTELMAKKASVLDRRNFEIKVFSVPPAGSGRFLKSEEDLDAFMALPVYDDPAAIGAELDRLLPVYLGERAEFPLDMGSMMLDLGESIGVLYHAADLSEFPIWSLTRRDHVSAFLGRVQKHFLEKYRWCLERDLADIYFLVGSELAAPPMVSLEVFREWVVPFEKELIELIHSYGKLVITHFHGQIRDLLPDFLDMAPDGLHTIEEPPTGNCPLEEAFRIVGDSIALIGTIQYDEFRALDPAAMRAEVRRVLDTARGHRFILSPSAGPFHPELPEHMRDNYLAFLDEGDEYGRLTGGRI
jgi:uroporphyrinogen-III decarboxylase